VFEAVILHLLVTFYGTFAFWAEVFLPKVNMEVENRMENTLFAASVSLSFFF